MVVRADMTEGSETGLLCERVSQRLRDQIKRGILKPGDRIPPVTKLVKEWGVDYRTVDSAFDLLEKDGLISRKRYQRPVVTKNARPVYTLALVRWCGDPMSVALVNGIQRFCKESGQQFVPVDAYARHENFLNFLGHTPEGIDGILLMPFKTPEYLAAIRQMLDRGIQVVFVDRILPGLQVSSVAADHFNAGYIATRHLIERCRQPVYHINIQDGPSSCQEWRRGWVSAMQENCYFDC